MLSNPPHLMMAPPPILTSTSTSSTFSLFQQPSSLHSSANATASRTSRAAAAADSKRKRRPAGTPDPDAEVVSLSPRTLLESDRYVCEICNQGFQRDQNLQMHRRRHKVPWKLLKRDAGGGAEARKRVFVCPEPSCLHHDPAHALGDLVGIKKHFRRKHSDDRRWACARCSKAYAVQSDYKAHLKTCGTRGHSCDCGRVFSRVETFIEHQDACAAARTQTEAPALAKPSPPPRKLATPTSPTPSADTNFTPHPRRRPNPSRQLLRSHTAPGRLHPEQPQQPNLELQLLPATMLELSIGRNGQACTLSAAAGGGEEEDDDDDEDEDQLQLRAAEAEKARAEEARWKARRQMEAAEEEFLKAKRLRQQAQAELSKAQLWRDHAVKQINAILLQITCHACKQQMIERKGLMWDSDESFLAFIGCDQHKP